MQTISRIVVSENNSLKRCMDYKAENVEQRQKMLRYKKLKKP